MGQYHKVVNLDKCEAVHPHAIAGGLKLWEQIANWPSTGTALTVLLASGSNGQGGGDLAPADIIGRWRGDRIAYVGDYDTKTFYQTPRGVMTGAEIYQANDWRDVAPEVRAVLAAELEGTFHDMDGWFRFTLNRSGVVGELAENRVS